MRINIMSCRRHPSGSRSSAARTRTIAAGTSTCPTSIATKSGSEFDGYVKNGDLPSLEVLTVMNDHFGNNETKVGGLKTPTLQMASNDHSVGLIVDAVTHSKYRKDTAIFMPRTIRRTARTTSIHTARPDTSFPHTAGQASITRFTVIPRWCGRSKTFWAPTTSA
jgi:hypothetical protein